MVWGCLHSEGSSDQGNGGALWHRPLGYTVADESYWGQVAKRDGRPCYCSASAPSPPHCPSAAAMTNSHKPSGSKPHKRESSPSPEGRKSKTRVSPGRVCPQAHAVGSLTQGDLLTEGPFSPSAKTLSPWEVAVQVQGALLSPRRKWRPVGRGGAWNGAGLGRAAVSAWVPACCGQAGLADGQRPVPAPGASSGGTTPSRVLTCRRVLGGAHVRCWAECLTDRPPFPTGVAGAPCRCVSGPLDPGWGLLQERAHGEQRGPPLPHPGALPGWQGLGVRGRRCAEGPPAGSVLASSAARRAPGGRAS